MDIEPPRPDPLPVIWLANAPDESSRVRCPPCQQFLNVRARTDARGERRLGLCPACGAWYALEIPRGWERWERRSGEGVDPDVLMN